MDLKSRIEEEAPGYTLAPVELLGDMEESLAEIDEMKERLDTLNMEGIYAGEWNASTNTPTLSISNPPTQKSHWIVSEPGSTNLTGMNRLHDAKSYIVWNGESFKYLPPITSAGIPIDGSVDYDKLSQSLKNIISSSFRQATYSSSNGRPMVYDFTSLKRIKIDSGGRWVIGNKVYNSALQQSQSYPPDQYVDMPSNMDGPNALFIDLESTPPVYLAKNFTQFSTVPVNAYFVSSWFGSLGDCLSDVSQKTSRDDVFAVSGPWMYWGSGSVNAKVFFDWENRRVVISKNGYWMNGIETYNAALVLMTPGQSVPTPTEDIIVPMPPQTIGRVGLFANLVTKNYEIRDYSTISNLARQTYTLANWWNNGYSLYFPSNLGDMYPFRAINRIQYQGPSGREFDINIQNRTATIPTGGFLTTGRESDTFYADGSTLSSGSHPASDIVVALPPVFNSELYILALTPSLSSNRIRAVPFSQWKSMPLDSYVLAQWYGAGFNLINYSPPTIRNLQWISWSGSNIIPDYANKKLIIPRTGYWQAGKQLMNPNLASAAIPLFQNIELNMPESLDAMNFVFANLNSGTWHVVGYNNLSTVSNNWFCAISFSRDGQIFYQGGSYLRTEVDSMFSLASSQINTLKSVLKKNIFSLEDSVVPNNLFSSGSVDTPTAAWYFVKTFSAVRTYGAVKMYFQNLNAASTLTLNIYRRDSNVANNPGTSGVDTLIQSKVFPVVQLIDSRYTQQSVMMEIDPFVSDPSKFYVIGVHARDISGNLVNIGCERRTGVVNARNWYQLTSGSWGSSTGLTLGHDILLEEIVDVKALEQKNLSLKPLPFKSVITDGGQWAYALLAPAVSFVRATPIIGFQVYGANIGNAATIQLTVLERAVSSTSNPGAIGDKVVFRKNYNVAEIANTSIAAVQKIPMMFSQEIVPVPNREYIFQMWFYDSSGAYVAIGLQRSLLEMGKAWYASPTGGVNINTTASLAYDVLTMKEEVKSTSNYKSLIDTKFYISGTDVEVTGMLTYPYQQGAISKVVSITPTETKTGSMNNVNLRYTPASAGSFGALLRLVNPEGKRVRNVSNVQVIQSSNGNILVEGVDYAVFYSAGTIRKIIDSPQVAVNVTFSYTEESKGIISMAQDNSIVYTPGTPRSFGAMEDEYSGQLPSTHVPLASVCVIGSQIYVYPVPTDIISRTEHIYERNRRLLTRIISMLIRGLPVKVACYGTSLEANQNGSLSSTVFNGPNRDHINSSFLTDYPEDFKELLPKYTDFEQWGVGDNTQKIHVQTSAMWGVIHYLREQYGNQVEFYNMSIGGTSSGTSGQNGQNEARLNAAVAANMDLVIIAFGMNELGSPNTASYVANIVNKFKDNPNHKTDCILQGVPRYNPSVGSIYNWYYTNDAIRRAAIATNSAYIPMTDYFSDNSFLGIPDFWMGYTNEGNHPSKYEMRKWAEATIRTFHF